MADQRKLLLPPKANPGAANLDVPRIAQLLLLSGNIHNIHMPNQDVYKFEIKCADPAGFTLNSVVSTPRTCTPLDLAAACKNIVLESTGSDAPRVISDCVQYLLTEFFALQHRTGLYNRQRLLWETLGRVTTVEAKRLTQGIFQKTELPVFDLLFKDGKGRIAIFGQLIEDEAFLADDKKQREYWRSLVSRTEKIKSSKGPTFGLLIFAPAPFPNNLLSEVLKQTSGSDPVGRYESLLPEPLTIAVDLLEYTASPAHSHAIRLVHPDLPVSTRTKST